MFRSIQEAVETGLHSLLDGCTHVETCSTLFFHRETRTRGLCCSFKSIDDIKGKYWRRRDWCQRRTESKVNTKTHTCIAGQLHHLFEIACSRIEILFLFFSSGRRTTTKDPFRLRTIRIATIHFYLSRKLSRLSTRLHPSNSMITNEEVAISVREIKFYDTNKRPGNTSNKNF